MKFLEMGIRNFMSVGDEQKVLLSGQGLTLIEGENQDDHTVENNGSGKSTIPEALVWALTGKLMRPDMSPDEVVHNKVEKDCCVWIRLHDDKGKLFTIERYRSDTEFKHKLRFLGPSRDLTQTENVLTQECIFGTLNLDYNSLVNGAIFGQGVMKHFAAMTDKEQKAIIDRLLGTEAFSKVWSLSRVKIKELEEDMGGIERGGAREKLLNLKESFREAKEEYEAWSGEQAERIAKAKAYWQEVLGKLQSIPQDLAKLCKSAIEDRGIFEEARAKADKDYQTTRDKRSKAEATADMVAKAKRAIMSKAGKCSSCGTEVDEAHLGKERESLEKSFQELMSEVKALAKECVVKRTTMEAKATLVAKADAHRADLDSKVERKEELEQLALKAKRMYDEAKAETNPHEKRVSRLREEVKSLRSKVESDEKKLHTIGEELKRHEFVETMFSDKGGAGVPPLKGVLFDSVAPFLNKKASHYSRFLSDGALSVRFETQRTLKSGEKRDEFAVIAQNRHGSKTYAGNSEGEKRKINTAVALALQALAASRNVASFNFAFWDEVFDHLDSTAAEYVMELLLDERKTKDSLFVITHLDSLKAYFPRRIRVVKSNGFSVITR